jgi:hypothetical protein
MAEFKNVFIKSKMNKDLDDRLLPQGEYRDALNIQVSKSESSDVGALENVLGNSKLINFSTITDNVNIVCVGYLASEVNSCVFFFLTDNTIAANGNGKYIETASNFIVRSTILQGTSIQNTVLVKGAFLNFWEGSPIYGVNLIEDLLFWTDNRNQPRKINVESAQNDITYYTIEDTISVAKYMPYNAPILWQEITSSMAAANPALLPAVGNYQTTMQDVVSVNLPENAINNGPNLDPVPNPYYDSAYRGDPDYLEEKFVRFSYRFKFDDGEYSLMAPFTQECFIPKQDGYFLLNPGAANNDENDMSAAYRSTIVDFMENKVNELTLLIDMPVNGDPAFPATTLLNTTDYFKITEIEILFKESDGAAVLVVDTISAAEIKAQTSPFVFPQTNTFQYVYSGTKPFRTLPEDQLTRVYDKVPVKALGQEVISNRIVYSNFQTRHTPPPTLNYNVGTGPKRAFDVTTPVTPVEWKTSIVEYPNSTLKQNRNYQAGFVLSDRFGRTTSTLLSNAAKSSVGIIKNLSTIYSPYNDETVNIGRWPGDTLLVSVNETINETPVQPRLYPGLYNGDPTLPTYNPLGFETWKIVVKQQEQDYYNVYLPGVLASYPEDATKELGLTSHVVLFNDNINKVPRDLAEVGPDQKQFRSSVQLFGRVQNTSTTPVSALGSLSPNLGVVNQQYYPSRFSDTVSTIQDEFGLFNVDQAASPFPNNFTLAFYEAESNPLIGRISTTNQVGQIVPTPPSYSIENLAVYETEPVESKLDIYWETSTSGTIADLNAQVIATGNQTIFGIVNFAWNFTEYWGIQTAASIPWDPTVTGSPEPASFAAPPLVPSDDNGSLGRFRSVIGRDGDTNSQFWFQDGLNVPIQDIEVVGFEVINNNNTDVTEDFDLLQIYGTSSATPGTGTYTNYQGLTGPLQANPTPAFTHDTFIIVNKSYRVWKSNNEAAQNFTVTIEVKDVAGGSTAPTFTRVFTPDLNDTVLDDEATIHVGAKQLPITSAQEQWGQVAQPIQNYLQPSPLPPDAGIFFEYGETAGNLVQFFGMNGANEGDSSGISPVYQNQNGLEWSITAQQQPFQAPDPGENPVTNIIPIFEINAVTGILTEIEPGQGIGLYYLTIGLTSGDSTPLANFNLKLTIGRPTASGSYSQNLRGANAIQLKYDNSYIINLHQTLGNGLTHDNFPPLPSWAYANLPIEGITPGAVYPKDVFENSYPEPGRLAYLLDPTPITDPTGTPTGGNGPVTGPIVPGLEGTFSNNGNDSGIGTSPCYKGRRMFFDIPTSDPAFCSDPFAGKQTLNLQRAAGNGFDGELSQGTGYINIEMLMKGINWDDTTNENPSDFTSFQKSEVSWAVEYREVINNVVQAWKPATDIEGNVLSWNVALDSSSATPVSNPQQSGLTLEGTAPPSGGIGNVYNDALHAKETQGTNGSVQGFQYGAATDNTSTEAAAIPVNFIRYAVENASSQSNFPIMALSRWVVVGNSPIYNTTPSFGEYRVIIQNIGGQQESCQSELVEFTNYPPEQGTGLQPRNIFSQQYGEEAGIINIGDFYYDLRPVGSPRAFGYIVHLETFTSGTDEENMASALSASIGNPAAGTDTVILYAEEGVPRYVSQFYTDAALTIPVTSVSSPAWVGGDGYIAYSCTEDDGDGSYNVPYSINNTITGQDPDAGAPPPELTANMASENAANPFQTGNFDQYERRWACKMDVSTGIKFIRTSVGKQGNTIPID